MTMRWQKHSTSCQKLNPSRSLPGVTVIESKWALELGGPGFMSRFLSFLNV